MHSSKLTERIIKGSYWDNIRGYLRYGDKAPLSEADREILDRIEYAKDLWQQHKEDQLVIRQLKEEYQVSTQHAYRILNDAKALFALFLSFNPLAELMIVKQRIDKGFILAEEHPEEYGKMYPKLIEQHMAWIEAVQLEQARQAPEEEKQITFIYHADWHELGVSDELMEDWKRRVEAVKQKVKRSNKPETLTDVEFTD